MVSLGWAGRAAAVAAATVAYAVLGAVDDYGKMATRDNYAGVSPNVVRVPMVPTDPTFDMCGDQTTTPKLRLYTMVYNLPTTGLLYKIQTPSQGWYDSDGNVVDPPIKDRPYQLAPGFQQINPNFANAQGHISNDIRQVLYEPEAGRCRLIPG